jgi:hypothetical protein
MDQHTELDHIAKNHRHHVTNHLCNCILLHLQCSRSFEAIACAGDVSLKEHEDFDKYAIEIRYAAQMGIYCS